MTPTRNGTCRTALGSTCESPVTGLLLAHHDLEINWAMRRLIIDTVDKELERTHGCAYMQDMSKALSQLVRKQGAASTGAAGAAGGCKHD